MVILLGIIALGLYWKNEESDIKVPFFVFLGLAIVINFMIGREEKSQKAIEGFLWSLRLVA